MSGEFERLGSAFFPRATGGSTCASRAQRLLPPSFTMENIFVRRLANLFLALALLFGGFTACQKKSETAAPAASPASGSPQAEAAPPITGPVTPRSLSRRRIPSLIISI